QLVINNRRGWQITESDAKHFLTGLFVGNNRESRRFGAGSRCCRNGDNRQSLNILLMWRFVAAHFTSVHSENCDRFGCIDRTAPSQADDAIEGSLLQHLQTGLERGSVRIRHASREDRSAADARLLEDFTEPIS